MLFGTKSYLKSSSYHTPKHPRRSTLTVWVGHICEDGGWICEKIGGDVDSFCRKKNKKMEGRENCHVLINLIFLTKYPLAILLKNSNGSNVQENHGWNIFFIFYFL